MASSSHPASSSRDPLSDPLSSLSFAQEEPQKPALPRASSSSWARHDFTAEPFSKTSWSQQGPPSDEEGGTNNGESNESKQVDLERRDTPSEVTRDQVAQPSSASSRLDPAAEPFVYTISSTPTSIASTAIPFASTSSRGSHSIVSDNFSDNSSPTSDGATPRADPSPFSASSRLALENSERTLDLQSTPPTSSILGSPPLSPAATSLKGLDLGALKGLIAQASSAGKIGRLGALLDGGDGTDDYPSSFVLANSPMPYSGMTPLHCAAKSGQLETCRFLIEEKGAMIDLEDAEGEVRHFLISLPVSRG